MAEEPLLLGNINFEKKSFKDIDKVLEQFYTDEFKKLGDRDRSDKVNRVLLDLIHYSPEPAFLMPEVLDYVERIDRENILYHYTFTSFELWLNHFAGLSFEDNLRFRGKIAGKWVPREEYQALFPIGMGKVYDGTHFVTAHKSPDLDTTIASFWGWVDAFAARVGDSLHVWNVPDGPPPSQIEIDLIFRHIFGPAVFTHLAKTRTTLTMTGNDIMSQKMLVKKKKTETTEGIDHERHQKAVVIVDEDGFYLGDWRSIDVEGVRQITVFFNNILRWFENHLHVNLISLFAKENLTLNDVSSFVQKVFGTKLKDSEPLLELSDKNKENLRNFLSRVMGVREGLESTFEEFGRGVSKLSIMEFDSVRDVIQSIKEAQLFDDKGNLIEDRPKIFLYLEKIIRGLHHAVQNVRLYMEQIDVVLQIKTKVFGFSPHFVTVRADVEEMRSKMGSYQYLTVTYPVQGKFYPVGIIQASDLRKKTLGTVSLRDFCNRNEMTIPSYLEVISVIDHHKSSLNTYTPPMAIISDAQSSNALVAEVAFSINDRYSLSGMSVKDIDENLKEIQGNQKTTASTRLETRLLQKRLISEKLGEYYIHPEREMVEYLHFLYGILDDTDLLMKVSDRDVDCVVSLLNRLKTLLLNKETEIISLDNIPKGPNFAKEAAKKILQNEDMYSLYSKVYHFREKEVEHNMELCAKGERSNVFSDTKEQNGCSRVGQTKMFSKNIEKFEKHKYHLRKYWYEKAKTIYREHAEIDLHLHMISTIVGADEVYQGTPGKYEHKDELWIWAAPTDIAVEHLKRFLNAFRDAPQFENNALEVEFLGDNAPELDQIFQESFMSIPRRENKSKEKLPIAVLYYNAGTVNSRKAMISPYLPVLAT